MLEITSTASATGHWLPVDGVEDHVSNATLAARRAGEVVRAGWSILAAEAVAVGTTLPSPPSSIAARWVLGLVDQLPSPLRVDRPLSASLAALAHALSSGR